MIIEVIVQNSEEAWAAEAAGAKRVELVSAISEGGMTPSYGTIKQVVAAVKIPVYVMVRPHGFHFNYSPSDMDIIKEDIAIIRELGAQGIVFGSLTQHGEIHINQLEEVLKCSEGLGFTFHRAFDAVSDQLSAYKTLSNYTGIIERVLTSGGKDKAEKAISQLQKLMRLVRTLKGPQLLIGAGLNPSNISTIHNKVQASEYHFGSGVRQESSFAKSIDFEKIKFITRSLGF